MSGLDVAIVVVVALIVAIALLPMIVLLDLAAGGTGLGLCRDGITSCRASYFDGVELLGILVLALLLLAVALRTLLRRRGRAR